MKPFPWKCGACREKGIVQIQTDYTTDVVHDGRTYSVTVPQLKVLRCTCCEDTVLGEEAEDKLSEALREQAGLLQPHQIRTNRERLGLTQEDLGKELGIANTTLSRWETGSQIQQRSLDKLMRLFFGMPLTRVALADQELMKSLGSTVTEQAVKPVALPAARVPIGGLVQSLGGTP